MHTLFSSLQCYRKVSCKEQLAYHRAVDVGVLNPPKVNYCTMLVRSSCLGRRESENKPCARYLSCFNTCLEGPRYSRNTNLYPKQAGWVARSSTFQLSQACMFKKVKQSISHHLLSFLAIHIHAPFSRENQALAAAVKVWLGDPRVAL